MLEAQLREKWLARERLVPIHTAMKFAPEGLVLGAGTVLIGAIEHRRLNTLEGQEPIVLALLCAAYGKAVPLKVLGNIERAINSWNAGDDCLAYIHLAHAGLPVLDDPYAAACRLFVADSVMKAGVSPRSIFQALRFDTSHTGAVTKLYNPTEPRVPAGSGRKSGQWTRLLSWIGEIDAGQLAELGAYASRVLGPAGAAVATFGLLFVPSPNKIRVEGEVAALPGLRYAWNRDETLLRLTYDDSNSERHTYSAQLDGDVFRDAQGRVIGRLLSGSTVAIDVAAVSPDLVNDDEPRMCPAPGPDRASNDLGRAYENYVKSIVNPYPRTTPSGIGFQLANPEDSGKLVYYDDCQHDTGAMVDAKGPSYAKLLSFPITMQSVVYEWVDESGRQIAASGGRPVRWYFAEEAAANFAKELFRDYDDGRERIEVVYLPWSRRRQ